MATRLARMVFDTAKNVVGLSDGKGGVLTLVTSQIDPVDGTTILRSGSTKLDLAVTGNGNATIPSTPNSSYTHVQNTPSNVWVVPHGLAKYPSVTVMDSGGGLVDGDIAFDTLNRITLRFSSAFSGKAYFN